MNLCKLCVATCRCPFTLSVSRFGDNLFFVSTLVLLPCLCLCLSGLFFFSKKSFNDWACVCCFCNTPLFLNFVRHSFWGQAFDVVSIVLFDDHAYVYVYLLSYSFNVWICVSSVFARRHCSWTSSVTSFLEEHLLCFYDLSVDHVYVYVYLLLSVFNVWCCACVVAKRNCSFTLSVTSFLGTNMLCRFYCFFRLPYLCLCLFAFVCF